MEKYTIIDTGGVPPKPSGPAASRGRLMDDGRRKSDRSRGNPEEVMKGIYRLEIPLPGSPLKAVNSYVIKGRERNLIIDTGMRRRECLDAMRAGLERFASLFPIRISSSPTFTPTILASFPISPRRRRGST